MAKEVKEAMSDAQAWNHIVSLFGENTLYHPNEIEKAETLSTYSPALDRALQVGGWARGRIYQVAGKPSSGKTFLALLAMIRWQSLDPENCCCFIDAEFTFDPVWFAKLGGDNDRVLLVKSNDAKKIFTGLVGVPKKNKNTGVITTAPGLLEMIDKKMIISHKVKKRLVKLNLAKMGVIVLDSIAVMQAPQEAESEVGKMNMAPLPRFLTTELKKLTPQVAQANVVFIAINHVKEKVGEMYGNPETTPGGAAFKHACSVMLMVAPVPGADNQLVDQNEEKFGHKIRVKVEKNKLGPPYKKAEFFIDFTSGVALREEQLAELGLMYNYIQKLNARTYAIGEQKFTSKEQLLTFVKENEVKVEEDVRKYYLDGETINLPSEGEPEQFEEENESPFEMTYDPEEYEDVVEGEE